MIAAGFTCAAITFVLYYNAFAHICTLSTRQQGRATDPDQFMSRKDASPAAAPASAPPYRRGFGRRFGPKLLLLATLILIVDALVGDKGLLERFREHQRFADAANALDAVRHENASLREQARRLREEDPATIETSARRQLGMIKPGEVLFIVKDVDGGGPASTVPKDGPGDGPNEGSSAAAGRGTSPQ